MEIAIVDKLLMLIAFGIIFFIDIFIVVMGWLFRRKFDFIPPKFFGVMSGKFTEEIIEKYGLGFTSNVLFMLPVYLSSIIWLMFLSVFYPHMVPVLIGMVIGFHLTLLLLSLMKLSIVLVLEQKYGKAFPRRVKKAVNAFLSK